MESGGEYLGQCLVLRKVPVLLPPLTEWARSLLLTKVTAATSENEVPEHFFPGLLPGKAQRRTVRGGSGSAKLGHPVLSAQPALGTWWEQASPPALGRGVYQIQLPAAITSLTGIC